MLFTFTLMVSLAIFVSGCVYKIGRWFFFSLSFENSGGTPLSKAKQVFSALIRSVFSTRVFTLLFAFLSRVIFQTHILRQSLLRWMFHMGISWGFLLLVVFHAMDEPVSANVFFNYEPTLNPFMFLRNLLGVLVAVGTFGYLARRRFNKRLRAVTHSGDIFALAMVLVIILSGFLLEGAKIISEPIFDEMVEEYMVDPEEEDLLALGLYWSTHYDVVFSKKLDGSDNKMELLALGEELNAENCMECHARPVFSFVSAQIARALKPDGTALNAARADIILWYVHFLAAFFALAVFPFTKFFHILSTPMMLVVESMGSTRSFQPATRAVALAMGFDACTHCGVCTLCCSVAPSEQILGNAGILPSEKIGLTRKAAGFRFKKQRQAILLSEGSFICTECAKCTVACPSGIDLQDLWQTGKKELHEKNYPELHVRALETPVSDLTPIFSSQASESRRFRPYGLTRVPEAFSPCIQCSICTSVCPVVAAADDPEKDPEIGPQQVMNLIRLGQGAMALGSRMVWDCVTCYQCQELCPSGIRVADVLYELRNRAWALLRSADMKKG